MQAAVGVAQLQKLPKFIEARKKNFEFYMRELRDYEHLFILPKKHPKAEPSPFGFPLTVRKDAGFTKGQVVNFLEGRMIETRMLFGGNLVRQTAYQGRKYEKIGTLGNADAAMEFTFWVGVFPGITEEMRQYVADCIREFVKSTGK
jgi:CDP-6-deoxy-D-xylo-4-hexulose-3-dehydrase